MEPIVLPKATTPTTGLWERLAFLAATVTAVGSLYMSMGMGLHACPLCFYQRTFIMAVAGVLGVGIALRPPPREGILSILALPLATAGLGVALIHNGLIWSGILVCPLGILGLGTAPLQSLIAYLVVTVLLLPGALRRDALLPPSAPRAAGLIVLGALLALLSVRSSPPLPPFNPKYDAAGQRILRGCEPAGPGASAPAARPS